MEDSQDRARHTARPAPQRKEAPPTSLREVQKRMQECDDKLSQLEGELAHARGRLVEAEDSWLSHKAKVNLLLLAYEGRTNEDQRQAEALTRFDDQGRSGQNLHHDYANWKSQVETIEMSVSITQSRANTVRKWADTILAAGG